MSKDNTQLPAEWIDKLNTEALEKYPIQLHRVQNGLPADMREYERQLWLTGATEYAIKLHQVERDLKKANLLLKRVQKDFAGTVEMSERKSDRRLFTEIKTFLDGK